LTPWAETTIQELHSGVAEVEEDLQGAEALEEVVAEDTIGIPTGVSTSQMDLQDLRSL
jgi:hypothetical protein